jgi:hypothetical protein
MYYEFGEGMLEERPGWPFGVGYEPPRLTEPSEPTEPTDSETPQRGPIVFWEGTGMGAAGGNFFPHEALDPKWDENYRASKTEWFIPYVRRMASGETVSVGELLAAYRAIHRHDPITRGT